MIAVEISDRIVIASASIGRRQITSQSTAPVTRETGRAGRPPNTRAPVQVAANVPFSLKSLRGDQGGMEMRSKSIKTSAQETVVVAGKRAAEEAKVFAGEVADAAAAAAATTKAVAGVILNKVVTAIEARTTKGAKALAGEAATMAAAGGKPRSRAKKKVAERSAAKKRVAPKKKAHTKKASRKAAKKKRV